MKTFINGIILKYEYFKRISYNVDPHWFPVSLGAHFHCDLCKEILLTLDFVLDSSSELDSVRPSNDVINSIFLQKFKGFSDLKKNLSKRKGGEVGRSLTHFPIPEMDIFCCLL